MDIYKCPKLKFQKTFGIEKTCFFEYDGKRHKSIFKKKVYYQVKKIRFFSASFLFPKYMNTTGFRKPNLCKKLANCFHCEICDYKCSKRSDLQKHILTRKHQKRFLEMKKPPTNFEYICPACSRNYQTYSGLWKHQKKCGSKNTPIKDEITPINNDSINEMDVNSIIDVSDIEDSETIEEQATGDSGDNTKNTLHQMENIIRTLVQENKEMRDMMMKQQEHYHNEIQTLIPRIGNNNNSNNKFNLNIFLNEYCKDAINMVDFINNHLDLQANDLEDTARIGFTDGMTRIILRGLKQLEFTKRPLHCSDLKRETLYIKDNDKWEKDNQEKDKLKKVITQVKRKTLQQIPAWMETHPMCSTSGTKENEDYFQMIQVLSTNETKENRNITKQILKGVAIEKCELLSDLPTVQPPDAKD